MKFRVLATLATFAVWGISSQSVEVVSPLISGPAAVQQWQDSDRAYVESRAAMKTASGLPGAVNILFLIGLGVIWYGPVRKTLTSNT